MRRMMTPREETPDVQEVLQEHFGFASLRKGQDEVVGAIMEGRDALAIMPTGGGKSLCYQLPALCRPGLTVVVSPLIALMKDQVDALQERNIPAAAVNSSLGADEYRQVMGDLRAGRLKIIYVAPERFAQEGFMSLLRGMSISLLAIDEAHCLSQWGHDFRPDYLRLGRARAELGYPQTVALTATATDTVREDILRTLELRDPAVIISGFGRQNLDFSIVHCENRKAKFERIRSVMDKWGQGIIYCSTRKNVMAVYEEISGYGRQVVAYHAGMTDEEREFSQEAFISGRADVVVATNAFGMGIDRADVRFVVHFEIPGSVEAYYQEAGRAGRDGLPAVCELLFNHADLKTQEFFFEGSNPPLQTIRAVYNLLRREASPATNELQMTVDAMVEKLGKDVNPMAAGTALSLLMHAGAIERFDVPGRNVRGTRLLRPELRFEDLPLNIEALEEKAARDHRKIDAITRYAYCIGCRQQWILQYFGETDSEPCGHCDACREAEGNNYPPLAGEELTIVRKALSGVARACRHPAPGIWEGIYGRGKIMDMLRGAKSANMNRHLTGLSTYGILSQMTDTQMKALFRAMQEGALLSTTGGEMPLISLSAKGEAVMMGREEARISRRGWAARDKKAARERAVQALSALANAKQDKELYARLAELRNDIAAETHMPAYRVLRNETMRAMAATKPTTMEAAERLKGVGPWLRTHFLRSFVELIRDDVES